MPAPGPARDRARKSSPLPSLRGWWMVAAAVGVGMALFLLIWLGQRGDDAPVRADEQAPATASPAFRPLPAPPPGGLPADTTLPETPESAARIEEPAARAPARPPEPPPGTETFAGDSRPAETGLSASSPVPIENPGPRYPPNALRRGQSGEVLLRIHVDARGLPAQVEVISSSGSTDLDRAARDAVRRWRFRPAMRDGTPTAGVVNVPILFESGR
ncbi:energy transducer TonB [Luteimonas sp. MC1782]|uniref:energy transducer TonB n=1 Tax=Luteimonas sp. MC1782 TaxID=2760305 RepID=UPI0015FF4BB0|nr:energy transducer TonB [Luteimonas sp. MC1782]MBB1472059.1 energy transducer TonB [Luteimonas sp. MC1782]